MTQPPQPPPAAQRPPDGQPADPSPPARPPRSGPPWGWIIGLGCGALVLLVAALLVATVLLVRADQRADGAATPTSETPTHVSASPTSAPSAVTPASTSEPTTVTPTSTLEPTTSTPISTPAPDTVTLTYEVTFPGARANIIYRAVNGDSEFPENVRNPWRKELAGYDADDLPYASVTARRSGTGPITCRILVNGKVVVENTEKGHEAGVACLYYLQAR